MRSCSSATPQSRSTSDFGSLYLYPLQNERSLSFSFFTVPHNGRFGPFLMHYAPVHSADSKVCRLQMRTIQALYNAWIVRSLSLLLGRNGLLAVDYFFVLLVPAATEPVGQVE